MPSGSSGPPKPGSSGRSQLPGGWRSRRRSSGARARPRPWAGRCRASGADRQKGPLDRGTQFLESGHRCGRTLTEDVTPTPRYDPNADLRWLLLRPWVLVSRLIVVLWRLAGLGLRLAVQSSSTDARVQQRLARAILETLNDLGPCFIKVGQALSTRPDLVRRDWLEELARLQDDLPPFPHAVALALIEAELGGPGPPAV